MTFYIFLKIIKMSGLKNKIIVNLNKDITNFTNKSNSKSKNNNISNNNINNNKSNNNNLFISINSNNKENKQNNSKTIVVERKLDSSNANRNKNNMIKLGNSQIPSNKKEKKEFSFSNQKNENKNLYNNDQKIIENGNEIYIKNKEDNNNYLNNLTENKIFAYENDDKNTDKNEMDFDTLIGLNIVNNIKEKEKEKSSENNNINVTTKDTPPEKSNDAYSLDRGPSMSSLNSLNKTVDVNSSSSGDDINNLQNQKNLNYSRDKTSSDKISKKKLKIKNKIYNLPVNLKKNKNFENYKPDPFFSGSKSDYSLPKNNKTKKIYNNLTENINERNNNSVSLRKFNYKYNQKDNGSNKLLNEKMKKVDEFNKAKNYHKIKVKIDLKNKDKVANRNLKNFKKMNLSKNKLSIKNLDTNEINNYNSCYLSSNKKKDPNRTNISQNSNNTYYNNTYNNSFNNIYNAYDTIGIDKKRKEMNISNSNNKSNLKKFNSINKFKKQNFNFSANKNNNKNNNNNNYPIRLNFEKSRENKSKNNNSQKKLFDHNLVGSSEILVQRNNSLIAKSTYNNNTRHNLKNNKFNNCKPKYIKKIKDIQSLCKRGFTYQGEKKLNQDNYFIFKNFLKNSNYLFIGVCDGHGTFGQNISSYLKENLPQNLHHHFLKKKVRNLPQENSMVLSQIISQVYQTTNEAMNEDERIDSSLSGSTCVSLIFTPQKIFCINVGDSRCVLGKYDHNKKKWIPMNLSRDHKPSDENEKKRILQCGGRVESLVDEDDNFVGPERVWIQSQKIPGLAMSRSFGDEIVHEVGVIVDPEIFEHFLDEEDKFIILASDGIWEFMSSDEVVNIVKDFYLKNDINGAIEYLYQESNERWITYDNCIDDITLIILFFE